MKSISAPTWDNSTEYMSVSSEDFKADFEKCLLLVSDMEAAIQPISSFLFTNIIEHCPGTDYLLLNHVKFFLSKQHLAQKF